jgi:thiol-disulfide isomerase/thioredoxin
LSKRPDPRKSGSNRTSWIIVAVVLVIGLAALVALVSTRNGKTNTVGTTTVTDPAALVSTLSGVNSDTITAVGKGSATALPTPIEAPDLTKDGKPLVVYIGAEYCPYCAAERWAMVQALSRFGSFSDLSFTHSSGNDVFPNTATLTFHGSSYTSSVLSFQGVETQTVDGKPLDTPTADQEALSKAYNPKGSIPFIDFGGKYTISGASYSPGVLAGKTADQITAALSDPGSAITKGIVGTSNVMTATICILTNDQPSAVCSNSAVQDLEAKIKAQS